MTDDRMDFRVTYRVVYTARRKHHIIAEHGREWQPSICGLVQVEAGRPASMPLQEAERHGGVCRLCRKAGQARGLWTWT